MSANSNNLTRIKVPRSMTAMMQLLQLLVIRGHYHWVGGQIAPDKLKTFFQKMAARYPLARNARGRAYDRTRGKASTHFVAYPRDDGHIAWFILSTAGKGGLADPAMEDHRQAKKAMSADGHLVFGSYVLLYAHKLSIDAAGRRRNHSTWTWRVTDSAFAEQKAAIELAVGKMELGSEAGGFGVLGLLAMLRRRPLFSGVRRQVIELHEIASQEWGKVHKKWLAHRSPKGGNGPWPLPDVRRAPLPTMPRLPLYADPARTLADLSPVSKPRGEAATER